MLAHLRAEHLGDDQRDYKLHKYLSLGEFSAAGESDAKDAMELYREAMKAIFEDAKPCHRCGRRPCTDPPACSNNSPR